MKKRFGHYWHIKHKHVQTSCLWQHKLSEMFRHKRCLSPSCMLCFRTQRSFHFDLNLPKLSLLFTNSTNAMATRFERPGVKWSSREPWGCVCGESLFGLHTEMLAECSAEDLLKKKRSSLMFHLLELNVFTACDFQDSTEDLSSVFF